MTLEQTPLLNPEIRSNSSESLGSSSSTVVVDIISTTDETKKYGTVETSPAPEPSPQAIYKGILDMFLCCGSFAIMHLTMKVLIKDGFPVSEILLFRSVTTVIVCTLYANYAKIPGGSLGPVKDRFWLNFRGAVGAFATITFFLSLQHLDLGDTLALSFISPVIMPIMAYFWLNEGYTLFDAGATFLAMTGVIFISKPEFLFGSGSSGSGSSSLGLTFALISATTGSIGNLSIRKLSSNSQSIHIVNYMMLWTLPACLIMIGSNVSSLKYDFSLQSIINFIIIASFSFSGQFWMSRSFLTTPARFISPIMFTQVIYAYINQFVIWGIQPTSSSTFGVLLVAFSLAILHFKI